MSTKPIRIAVLVAALLTGHALAQPTSQPADDEQPERRPSPTFTGRDFGLRFDYQTRHWFTESSDQPGRSFAASEQALSMRIPVASYDRGLPTLTFHETWQLTAGLRSIDFDTDVRIPRSRGRFNLRGRDFPTHVWNPTIGVQYQTQANDIANPDRLGFTFEVSSPSDRPFHSGDEIAVSFNGFWRVPFGERDAWWFYVAFANAREFAPFVPLPGVAYEWRPSDELTALVGFPFNRLRYQPTDWLRLTGQYIFPRRVDTELAFLLDGWELFTGYAWSNETFFLHDRRNDDDRLLSYEQRVRLGLRSPKFLDDAASFELEGGYAFDRFLFEGEDFDDRFDSRINLNDGPYVRLMLRIEL